jgi:hypothetical protein
MYDDNSKVKTGMLAEPTAEVVCTIVDMDEKLRECALGCMTGDLAAAHARFAACGVCEGIQRLWTQPGLPMKQSRCGTMTHDYKRNGTATLFAASDAFRGM